VEFTRSLVDRAIGRPDRVAISEIQEEVNRRFMGDQQFVFDLARMNVAEIVNAAIREAIAETRGSSRARVIVRDFITTPAEMVADSKHLMETLSLRWGRFLEWDGRVHVRLVAMKRQDLLNAAKIRRDRAMREIAYAEFFETLAARLPDDDATVGAEIPVNVIEEIFVTVQDKYGRLDPIPPGGVPTHMGSDLDAVNQTGVDQGEADAESAADDAQEGGAVVENDPAESDDPDAPQQP